MTCPAPVDDITKYACLMSLSGDKYEILLDCIRKFPCLADSFKMVQLNIQIQKCFRQHSTYLTTTFISLDTGGTYFNWTGDYCDTHTPQSIHKIQFHGSCVYCRKQYALPGYALAEENVDSHSKI